MGISAGVGRDVLSDISYTMALHTGGFEANAAALGQAHRCSLTTVSRFRCHHWCPRNVRNDLEAVLWEQGGIKGKKNPKPKTHGELTCFWVITNDIKGGVVGSRD